MTTKLEDAAKLDFVAEMSEWIEAFDDVVAQDWEQGTELLEALRKRNARKASAIMDSHIMSGGDQLIEILEERGLWAWQDEDAAS